MAGRPEPTTARFVLFVHPDDEPRVRAVLNLFDAGDVFKLRVSRAVRRGRYRELDLRSLAEHFGELIPVSPTSTVASRPNGGGLLVPG
jgi:hypothetical protein